MTDRELMQQALDVMLAAIKAGDWKVDGACDPDYVLEALRARLAQPEPTLALWNFKHNRLAGLPDDRAEVVLIRQREWQGLTDEEIGDIIEASQITLKNYCSEDKQTEYARAIEAKLKEKNT